MRSWRERRALLALLASLAACGSAARKDSLRQPDASRASTADAGDLDGPWSSLAQRPCPPDSALTYEDFGAPFFLNYCEGCHGGARTGDQRQMAPPAVSFDMLDSIRAQAPKIWSMAADTNTRMPPVGGPSADLRKELGEWLACGAPERR